MPNSPAWGAGLCEKLIHNRRVDYEGLFSVQEFFKLIKHYFREKQYDWREYRNIEMQHANGKYIEIELEPWKTSSDYFRSIIRIRIFMREVQEVEMETKGHSLLLNRGKIHMTFEAWLQTDKDVPTSGFGTTTVYRFLRIVTDKWMRKSYISHAKAMVVFDCEYLINLVQSYLNTQSIHGTAW
ncbi:hypothetical protein COY95_01890 [Candidatus Woesearchaeota archaeon CG_4_10_14_0_8_um_filter_47_5]|nr:MAG: hypothetical protein COY95_01890 [Candidatus Woesearchaeota archaeon CG_4_10_14_0_8_um_filter_47_5]